MVYKFCIFQGMCLGFKMRKMLGTGRGVFLSVIVPLCEEDRS